MLHFLSMALKISPRFVRAAKPVASVSFLHSDFEGN